MSQPLPPPIGANRIGDDEAPPELRGPSTRTRLLVAGAALLVAVVAGIVAYRAIAAVDDDDDGALPSWDAVAGQELDGTLAVFDASGEELDSFTGSTGAGQITASGRFTLTQIDESATIVDVTDGTSIDLELAEGEQARFLDAMSSIVYTSSPSGGNVRLFDPATGVDIDVADVASLDEPLIYGEAIRADLERQVVGLVDDASFQSVIISVDPDADTEPVFLPGRLVDLRHGSALTVQRAGERAEMTFHELDGDELGTVDVPSPTASVLTDADTALVLTSDGGLVEISASLDEPSELATLDVADDASVPARFLPAAERLVYQAASGETVVVDHEADEVVRQMGDPRFVVTADVDLLRCLAVVEEAEDPITPATTRLYDVERGEPVGDPFDSDIRGLGGSADGCVVGSTTREGSSVTSDRGTTSVSGDLVAISPDGSAYLARTDPATLAIHRLEGDEADAGVEVDAVVGTFVERS